MGPPIHFAMLPSQGLGACSDRMKQAGLSQPHRKRDVCARYRAIKGDLTSA